MKKEENDVEIVLGGLICVIVMGAFLSIVFNYITTGSHRFESYFGLIFLSVIFSFIIIGIISLQSMMNNGSFEKTNKKIDELKEQVDKIDTMVSFLFLKNKIQEELEKKNEEQKEQ